MRPITKILLFLVAAFVVYLVWPRTPSLRAFNPSELARLKLETWKAQQKGGGMGALVARFRIYATQFHFSPVTALQLARIDGDVFASLQKARGDKADFAEENRVLNLLGQKYSMIKQATRVEIDPDAIAREELLWRTLLLDGAPPKQVAAPMARILASLYGGQVKDFNVVALDLAGAQAAAFGQREIPEVTQAGGAAGALREGFALLKEIAATPVTGSGDQG